MPPSGKMPVSTAALRDQFDDLGHVENGIEIGGIFDPEMRHA